jgi:hypothetical protein
LWFDAWFRIGLDIHYRFGHKEYSTMLGIQLYLQLKCCCMQLCNRNQAR